MSAFHTCIARLAPSVVDNMYRQALLRWMIQFFQRHRHPKQESWQHWYRPLGTAAVTKLDNTVAVRSGNAAHSERCAGKTHTSYMTTWRSVGVRRGNVAYCLAFSAHTHHLYICTHMSWYRHVLRGTDCWDRGLSCEKAKGNVPVLRVHIIAFRWYFLGNEVLWFFFSFPFVSACHVLLIICTCLCPTFFYAYRIHSYCSLLYLRVFVHTFVHCTVPCVPSRVSHHRPCLNTVIWLHYIALLSSCAMYYCILLGLCRSCAPRFYCASVFTSLVPCPVPSVCM